MIHSIFLKNFVLFKEEEIAFLKGLNIITGETGSGKSAILFALSLLLGEKSDSSLIRQGEEKAYVEGVFSLDDSEEIQNICGRENLDFSHPITLRRELTSNGKSRSFFNDQLINLATLKEIGRYMGEIIDQNTHTALFSPNYQRELLDTFADLREKKKAFAHLWRECKDLEKEIEQEEEKKRHKKDRLLFLEEKIREIDEINLQEGEEKRLSDEHKKLSSMQETQTKIDQIYENFFQNPPLLTVLQKNLELIQSLLAIDPSFQETSHLLASSKIELEEVIHNIRVYKGKIQENPERLQEVEERLSQIFRLKKKYGNSFEDIQASKQEALMEKNFFIRIEEEIEEKKEKLTQLKKVCDEQAEKLSLIRKKAAPIFQEKIQKELGSVNLQNGHFLVSITLEDCHESGKDRVEFLFSANQDKPLPLEKCASGGEISRLLFLIKTTLAEKEGSFSIIFDEIDSNVGGTSASLLGKKLKKMGESRQVLSITHFTQVAQMADHHIRIWKEEKQGKVQSFAESLSGKKQQNEHERMLGLLS